MTRSYFQYLLLNFSWTKALIKTGVRFDEIFLSFSRTRLKIVIGTNIKIKKASCYFIFKKIISSYKHDINFETEAKAYFYSYRKNSSDNWFNSIIN